MGSFIRQPRSPSPPLQHAITWIVRSYCRNYMVTRECLHQNFGILMCNWTSKIAPKFQCTHVPSDLTRILRLNIKNFGTEDLWPKLWQCAPKAFLGIVSIVSPPSTEPLNHNWGHQQTPFFFYCTLELKKIHHLTRVRGHNQRKRNTGFQSIS